MSAASGVAPREERLGVILVFLSALLWSLGGTIARFIETPDHWAVVFWRSMWAIAFLVAYGELAIGLSLTLGLWVRAASLCAIPYMFALLLSSNYPGPHAAPWQYFGASLNHLVLIFCFAAFAIGKPEAALAVRRYLKRPA